MTGVVMLASAAGALALVLAVWLASLRLHDASIIDIFWGVGFIVIAWICSRSATAPETGGCCSRSSSRCGARGSRAT